MSKTEEKSQRLSEVGTPHPILRKAYQRPLLIEWGSLVELTRDKISGLDDFPLAGGTTPV